MHSVMWETTVCEERDGLFAILGLLQRNVDVIFGPVCSESA